MENTNVNVENQGASNTSSTNNVNNIDYSKIEEIVNKNVQKKENAVLKSYFEQQGLEENEIAEAIKAYKANKQNSNEDLSNKYNELNNNYSNLQKQLNQERLNNSINLALMKKGLSEEQIPYISKMVDTNGLFDDKNEISKDKLNESIENVFKAFPNLATTKKGTQSIKIGTSQTPTEEEGGANPFNFGFNSINKK